MSCLEGLNYIYWDSQYIGIVNILGYSITQYIGTFNMLGYCDIQYIGIFNILGHSIYWDI